MASTDTLILLSKAFDSYFKRARNRKRIMANNRRMARRNEKIMLPAAREMLDYMADEVRKGLPRLKSDKASAIKRMVDWEHIEEQAALMIKPAMLVVLAEGGKSIVERKIVKQERFDPIGVGAVNWASRHSADMVTGVVAETKKTIRTSIVAGIDAGKSIPKIARELRSVVGLTGRQAGAVNKFATELYTKPKYSALTDVQRNSKIDRYSKKLQRVRTETIARTETASALSEGTLQGYGQMGVNKVERIEDSDCCEICARNNGRVYTLAMAEGVLPAHPNCEGSWVAAVGEKLKPYLVEATGPRQAKVASLNDALKELPRRHAMSVEKYYIDTTNQMYSAAPILRGQDVAGYWKYGDKSVHINSKYFSRHTIFHETGHAVYETGIVPYAQKPVWKAWYEKATMGRIKYPSQYSLTNEGEFFAECYSNYYLKKYNLIDDGIKKWFDVNFKGG